MMAGDQFQRLLAAIEALRDHAPYWKQFVIAALPIFLASVLGFATALVLDWLKTRRENRKAIRERLEKELARLNGASTAMGFNIEALTHMVFQQILPHYRASYEAMSAINKIGPNDLSAHKDFAVLFYAKYQQSIVVRCPNLYVIEIDFF